MNKNANTNSGSDPGNNQADPIPALKQCRSCMAKLTISSFGPAKNSSDGLNHICKLCRSEYNSAKWTSKYGRSRPVDNDALIRSVSQQNSHVLSIASQVNTSTCDFECRAFSTVTKVDYKVFIGRSASLGLSCVCLFSLDGTMLRELSYSGALSTVRDEIISFLKVLNIRLELTEADAISSKTTIYYI